MTTAERKAARKFFFHRTFVLNRETAGVDTIEILAAIDALDDWFDAAPLATESTNQAQMLLALPAAFKNGTNGAVKAMLLTAVVMGRTGMI